MGKVLLSLFWICIKEDYFYLLGCCSPSNLYVRGCANDLHIDLKTSFFERIPLGDVWDISLFSFFLSGLANHTELYVVCENCCPLVANTLGVLLSFWQDSKDNFYSKVKNASGENIWTTSRRSGGFLWFLKAFSFNHWDDFHGKVLKSSELCLMKLILCQRK